MVSRASGHGSDGVAASGTLFLEHVAVYRDLVGEDAVDRALASVDGEVRRVYEACVPGAWIDVDTSVQLYTAIAEAAGRDVVDLHREAVHMGFTRTLTGLWKAMMLRLATDRAIVMRAPALFAKSFDGGKMSGELLGPGRARFEVTGWPGMPAVHRVGVCAGMEAVLELSGRKDSSIDHAPTPDGAQYRCRWG